MTQKRLVIIDAHSIIYRAFHALPPLTTKKGELVNAVYGFLLVLFRVIKEFHPEFIVACFDTQAPTFRHEQFKEYKAQRPPAPEGLLKQIPKVKEALKYFNIVISSEEGYEADDLIGTIAKKFSEKSANLSEIIILSGDSDMLQLVGEKRKVCLIRTGVKDLALYDKEKVKEKYQGLAPDQVADFKALKGDPTDNIPGVAGIGEKTAIDLLLKFGDIKRLYVGLKKNSQTAKLLKPRVKDLLLQNKEKAFLSKELAEIKTDVPLKINLDELSWRSYDKTALVKFLQDQEFHSLISRIPEPVEKKNSQITLNF